MQVGRTVVSFTVRNTAIDKQYQSNGNGALSNIENPLQHGISNPSKFVGAG